ncbi:MAG: molecular chaperone DjiA [Aestuariivita sp.]|nr:molecular chaperone DjiA [Aestuariivita sp.]MCY4203232.1 molecular chaperone DjiA [Aestuariivita sp.]MCY4287575.1 molecular chaperone DjiA [Aestuariivita sp.]MCY4346065.1 molecular chaperone DjiA [Aestuariivita sp.]
MSLWSRITQALTALAQGESLAQIFDKLRLPPERSVGFAIAIIALAAKMAKADGQVTRDEVRAFREVFHIGREDEAGAARVFNLARQDVAGYENYASKIARLFRDDPRSLQDLMEGLFHIAMADGFYHPNEDGFLHTVARIFGLPEPVFRSIRARFVPDTDPDPYTVLGVTTDMPLDQIQSIWRRLVRENHPDQMIARGVPIEAIKLAEKRMVDINNAWDAIVGSRPTADTR